MGYSWLISAQAQLGHSPDYLRVAAKSERGVWTKATHISVANDDLAREVVAAVPAAASKISVWGHYVDCDLFRPMDTAKRYDLIYIGRLTFQKNLVATLEAVERAGATIAIIGGGTPNTEGDARDAHYGAELKARFGSIGGKVDWLGVIPNELLPKYINQARALILCSVEEGHGRVVPEALACGIPVIGSKIGGIKSTLRHEETGYLCED